MDPATAQANEATPTPPQENQQSPGLQARIDELVARAKTAEQANQELMQRLMEQNARLMEQTAPKPVIEPDPLAQHAEALDPRLVQVLQAERQRMEAVFRTKMAQVEAQQGQLSIQAAAAQMRNVPAEVTQRAQQLYQQAKLNGSAATPDEALRYALGDWYLQQQQRGAQVVGLPTTAFNAPLPVPPSAPVLPNVTGPKPVPADFDNWPLQKQLTYMEQNGYADLPL
jgi:hypothetical protein